MTQAAELYRGVQVRLKWFVVPTTVSKVLTREEFLSAFGNLLETREVDGEAFWMLRKESDNAVRARIASFDVDNTFRTEDGHAYPPDSDPNAA